MKIVLSPAKRLDEGAHPVGPTTTPVLKADIAELLDVARELTVADLAQLMSISEDLATLNYERYQTFDQADEYAAMYLFAGDTYRGLDAASMDPATIERSQDHIRILSGLYGVLRPLDAMKPYRLEMGTKLTTDRGETLYDFWGTAIGETLKDELADGEVVVNGASKEYVTALAAKKVGLPMVDLRFENYRNGSWKVFGMLAKPARGAMARWIVDHGPSTVKDLHDFNYLGYQIQPARSTDELLVFRSRK